MSPAATALPPPPPPAGTARRTPADTAPAPGRWVRRPADADPGDYNVGTAWSYGWNKFTANLGQILVAVLLLVGVQIAVQVLSYIVSQHAGHQLAVQPGRRGCCR